VHEGKAVGSAEGVGNSAHSYRVYAAGGMFTQHELATNVLIKEAVWRLSSGRFQLVLPQSGEVKEISAAYLRNVALLEVVKADIVVARFDGLELDSGTVLEFAMAKVLGKPTVIFRSDYHGLLEAIELPPGMGLEEPYNLMVKSWPRTVEVHVASVLRYLGLLADERKALGDSVTFQAMLEAELTTIRKSVDEIAKKLMDGLEAVIGMKSPYPPEYHEIVYRALRYSPGSGFDQLLTENELDEIVQRLRENATL
jgi:nucleoside 2-deoxyribosyltransferase